MNTPNNKRKRESIERMEKVFIELLQTKQLHQISVSEICKQAGLNRTTFYANYADVYALADSIREKLVGELAEVYGEEIAQQRHSYDYLKLFRHIRDNQLFYQTYFKLGYDENYEIIVFDDTRQQSEFGGRFIQYHAEFFKSGITRLIKLWLKNGCQESPEDMLEILRSEYQGRILN